MEVSYTNDPVSAWKWAEEHLGFSQSKDPSSIRVVGFDVESAPNLPWRRDDTYFGPATLQLAVHDNVLVLQIAQESVGPLYENLRFVEAVLNQSSLLLTGVGMDQDMIELYRWSDEMAKRRKGHPEKLLAVDNPLRLDIGGIGAESIGARGGTAGLKRLAAAILQVQLQKSSKLAQSPWAKAPLTQKCVVYAARDAWTSAAVLHRLCQFDAQRFSPSVLKELVEQYRDALKTDEKATTVEEMSIQASVRRKYKLQWKELREKGKEFCTEAENKRLDYLQERIKELAPPQPIPFETEESLGIRV